MVWSRRGGRGKAARIPPTHGVLVALAVLCAAAGWLAARTALPASGLPLLDARPGLVFAAAWGWRRHGAAWCCALVAAAGSAGFGAASQAWREAMFAAGPAFVVQATLGAALVRRGGGGARLPETPEALVRFLALAGPAGCAAGTLAEGLLSGLLATAMPDARCLVLRWAGHALAVAAVALPALAARGAALRGDWRRLAGSTLGPLAGLMALCAIAAPAGSAAAAGGSSAGAAYMSSQAIGRDGDLARPLLGGVALLALAAALGQLAAARAATLASLRRRLARARLAAAAAQRARAAHASALAHELRTPLQTIVASAYRLQARGIVPPGERDLERLRGAAQRLRGRIDDLLDGAALQAGTLAVDPVPFDLDEVLQTLAEAQADAAREHRVRLALPAAAGVPLLLGDPLRLRQLLDRLVGHAIRGASGGEVALRIACTQAAGRGPVALAFLLDARSGGVPAAPPAEAGEAPAIALAAAFARLLGGHLRLAFLSAAHWQATVDLHLAPASAPAEPAPAARPKRLLVVGAPASAAPLRAMAEALGLDVSQAADAADALRQAIAAAERGRPIDAVLADGPVAAACGERLAAAAGAARPLVLQAGGEHAGPGVDRVLAGPCTPAALAGALAAPPERRRPSARQRAEAAATSLRGVRVLLVEDNDVNAELAAELLAAAGIVVTRAEHGRAALACLAGQQVDLVLMDVCMPVMDGHAATRAIRAQARHARLPVLGFTANCTGADRDAALGAGMNEVLGKPFDVEALFAALVRWSPMRAGGGAAADPAPAAAGLAAGSQPVAVDETAGREPA